MILRASVGLLLATLASVLAVDPAAAAPPPNDPQGAPQAITLPADVRAPPRSPRSSRRARGTLRVNEGHRLVRLHRDRRRRVVVRLQAAGDLDAQVSVFLRQRSQTQPIDCDPTDPEGVAQVSFTTRTRARLPGPRRAARELAARHLPPGGLRPQPAPTAPGARLPAHGATGVLDSVENTADAFYRVGCGPERATA